MRRKFQFRQRKGRSIHPRLRLALAAGALALCGWAVLRLMPSRPVPAAPEERAGELAAAPNSTARESAAHDTAEASQEDAEPFYIGSAQCAECHADEVRSYQQTGHSQALAEIDPEAQPPDGRFDHALSGRTYRVYRAGGAFRHREQLSAIDDEALSQDYAVKYVIGSGRHGRSYLIEDDGFLIESPITWYESRKVWGMSPGYDRRQHPGFERGVDAGCITCHAGQAENIDGALNRIAIHEQAIGCEACHGPGSTHVARRRAANAAATNDRDAGSETIVHPGKLARDLGEAICARCHLSSAATVFLSGRSVADFRPGHPLSDYRIDYRLDRPSSRMKVTGHVEQMRLSRCYQQSDSLTCTTCHNPHSAEPTNAVAPERAAAEYRSKCLECHAPTECGLDVAERTKTEPGDNCAACHMPPTQTDVPHAAFTHHRIGIHRAAAEAPFANQASDDGGEFAELTPLADVSHLSEIERDRCLGLAYLEFEPEQSGPAIEQYRRRAVELLEKVRAQGLRDASVDAGLARMYWSMSPQHAAQLAAAALQDSPLPPSESTTALYVLADFSFRTQQWAAAQSALVQAVRLRRHPLDWQLLGLSQAAQGDAPGAIQSLERAAHIIPYDRALHEQLARLYAQQGQTDAAERQRQLAKLLEDFEKDRGQEQ